MILGLQNDHKALMKEIEEGLYTVHAEIKAKKSQSEESGMEVGHCCKGMVGDIRRRERGGNEDCSWIHGGEAGG